MLATEEAIERKTELNCSQASQFSRFIFWNSVLRKEEEQRVWLAISHMYFTLAMPGSSVSLSVRKLDIFLVPLFF